MGVGSPRRPPSTPLLSAGPPDRPTDARLERGRSAGRELTAARRSGLRLQCALFGLRAGRDRSGAAGGPSTFLACSVLPGIYPRRDELRGPRDTLPTRLSAQYLISRLLAFRLRD